MFALMPQAHSAEFDVIDTAGGTVTLITAPLAKGSTQLRGMIEIALLPGWKTYWRDPGNGGIAPSLTLDEAAVSAQPMIHFPAPKWLDDDEGGHAGYDLPVSIPFTVDLPTNTAKSPISGRLMVGICKDICIPAFADVTLPVEPILASSPASIAVDQAFSALPVRPKDLSLSIDVKPAEQGSVDIVVTGGVLKEIYASGINGEQLKRPVETSRSAASTIYRLSPLRVRDAASKMDIFITGITEDGSFETRTSADFSQ